MRRGAAEQVEEARILGGAAILFGRPAERLEQTGRIEDVPPRPLGPVRFDQADDGNVIERAVSHGLIVEQMHAALGRVGGEGVILDRATHGNREIVDRPLGIVFCRVRSGQAPTTGRQSRRAPGVRAS